jgi:hypothetical protein
LTAEASPPLQSLGDDEAVRLTNSCTGLLLDRSAMQFAAVRVQAR